MHYGNVFETVTWAIRSLGIKISLSKKRFKEVESMVFDKCAKCHEKHHIEYLLNLFHILKSPDQIVRIKKIITDSLNEEYDMEIHYEASLFDVIGSSTALLNKFIKEATPIERPETKIKVHTLKLTFRDHKVDMLINYCFKLNVNLKTTKMQSFVKMHPYYDWLLNLKTFDYKNFDPQWINEYPTKYYFNKFRKEELIKEHLGAYLKENKDSRLERSYFTLYGGKET